MFNKAKNETLRFDEKEIDYITFGRGSKVLVMIPGVGDGLKTVKGLAKPFAFMYRKYAKDFKVYVFSRKRDLQIGYTTKEMADDIATSLNLLGITKADVVGVSQGGMIVQHLAINHPDKIDKLVLAITSSRPNDLLVESVDTWVKQLKNEDFKSMMIDNAKRSYLGKKQKRMVKLYKRISFVVKPKSYERFIAQALSCKEHNAYDKLNEITNNTLIIGAEFDGILGCEPSYEIHNKISNSKIHIFKNESHGVFETKEFDEVILEFLNNSN